MDNLLAGELNLWNKEGNHEYHFKFTLEMRKLGGDSSIDKIRIME